jgi:hypothetical protein
MLEAATFSITRLRRYSMRIVEHRGLNRERCGAPTATIQISLSSRWLSPLRHHCESANRAH